jgi:hypothetical protein
VSPDLTKLIGGGGVGLVLLVALYYVLKDVQARDERDEMSRSTTPWPC